MAILDSFGMLTTVNCSIKDWIRISESPDGFWNKASDFPTNWLSHYVYPHSDSICVGGGFICKSIVNLREIIEGKLTKPLTPHHHYQFSMYVQLFDSIPWNDVGKIVGSNSFSAMFTDTMIPSHLDLPIQNYHPQIQIDSMVIDTQHWVLLVDTFIAAGGEQFVSIGNFKTDAQTQTQLVKTINNKPEVAYYFIDDVSLIDLDEVGIEEVEKNRLEVYPNPADKYLDLQFTDNEIGYRIIFYNYLGTIQTSKLISNKIRFDVEEWNNGLYLYSIFNNTNELISKGKISIIHK
ncbi:MAG: hypothetical protein RJA07_2797 [Bacteroidota bacterium]|jgi:hypothetical protein